MKYDILLFDADGTLLDFDKAEDEALKQTLLEHGLPYTPAISGRYHEINDSFWKLLEQGKITREFLQARRFAQFLEELGSETEPALFNRRYRNNLGKCAHLLPGAFSLCEKLCKRYSMAIVTNGASEVQHRRLAASGLAPLFQKVYISEEIGWQKPDKRFFDFVFSDFPVPDPRRVLIIGDSLTSDVQGGRNAGIDTCWFCPSQSRSSHAATYQVSDYRELAELLEK